MTKSRHLYKKNNKTKTKKNKKIKKPFLQEILQEWKKQTGGIYEKDKMTKNYQGDYYLSFQKTSDFYNHVHLVLKHFPTNHTILYVFKKMDTQGEVKHSKEFNIRILRDPKKVVRIMIQQYKEFSKL
jgi:hypothetical protein